MGRHGPRRRVRIRKRAAGQELRTRLPLVLASSVLLPVLAACSSASSPSGGDYTSYYPYPSQSLADAVKHSSDPPASQSNCVPAPTGSQAGAAASAPASCSAVAANPPPPPADPVASAYPHGTSLVDAIRSLGSAAPAQPAPAQPATSMPHPPSTYTPVSETYGTAPPAVPPPQSFPAAQPASAPPSAAANAAAPPPPADNNPTAGVYPQQSLVDLFTKKPASQ